MSTDRVQGKPRGLQRAWRGCNRGRQRKSRTEVRMERAGPIRLKSSTHGKGTTRPPENIEGGGSQSFPISVSARTGRTDTSLRRCASVQLEPLLQCLWDTHWGWETPVFWPVLTATTLFSTERKGTRRLPITTCGRAERTRALCPQTAHGPLKTGIVWHRVSLNQFSMSYGFSLIATLPVPWGTLQFNITSERSF